MTDKQIIIKGKNKTVQEILQSFVGLPATLVNKERLLYERRCFLDKYFYSFLTDLNTPKSGIQWECFIKICNILMQFDNLYENTLYEEEILHFHIRDIRAKEIISELTEDIN